MVDYLNLTSGIDAYMRAYCTNPRSDDSCPFGYCAQSDIAGILVRASTYVSAMCFSILLQFSKEEDSIKAAFYSSLLSGYSLILTAWFSVFKGNLSRFHALIVFYIVNSPLWSLLIFYAIRSLFISKHHRLYAIIGRHKPVQLILVLGWGITLLLHLIYVLLPQSASHFSQRSCDTTSFLVQNRYWIGFSIYVAGLRISPYWMVIGLSFVVISCVTLIPIIGMRYNDIRANMLVGGFFAVSDMIRAEYPFIYFLNTVISPFIYWVGTVESALQESPIDNRLDLPFGQVLAVFLAIPPIISVLKLHKHAQKWLVNLTWICAITGRPLPLKRHSRQFGTSRLASGNTAPEGV
ncbi:hypothetical protein BDY19DRAFT_989942 [Irpex rosettiformis]|uniref:Uncharacterized protein n=1 Tax=Irpex rosettiformis TaxID=378272 RepID=A0ACB8UG90_9APHY|nr:hypothetical protein BDY19DRAFT_989942 [Irpex rosettiformis]